jgi:hypothetical protein
MGFKQVGSGKVIPANLSDMQRNIQRNIAASQAKVNQRDECWGVGKGFDARFIPIQPPWNQYSINQNPDSLGPVCDLEFRLPTPYRIFFVNSVEQGFGANHIFFSTSPVGLSYTAGGLFANPYPNGGEQWFSLFGVNRNDRSYPFIKFSNPIDRFYLTLDTASGSQYNLSLCCTNDEEIAHNLGWLDV